MSVTIASYNVDLLDEVGSGTFGTVFKGKHSETGECVAVKKINYGTGKKVNEEMLKMAHNELSILRKLNEHKNIVRLIEHHNDEKNMWLIMEFCELGDLSVYLEEGKALDISTKIKIMTECASALNFMHSLDPPIVHRDIKPSNVLMKKVGTVDMVKMTDFGIGKMYEYKPGLQYQLTMSTLAGSPYFMAPELFGDGIFLKYQPSVDTFSLGLLFQVILLFRETYKCMIPLSAEVQGSTQGLPFGKELSDAVFRKTSLPKLFKSSFMENKELQDLITEMTSYQPSDRLPLQEVEKQILKINPTKCKYYTHVATGLAIHVLAGDITTCKVDAVVSATDAGFAHEGGVAHSIISQGGSVVMKECESYKRKNGSLPLAGTLVTDAGNLPCQKVIHVFGPMRIEYKSSTECSVVLKKAFDNILEETARNQLTSVAIPGVSAGLHGVPQSVVAACTFQSIEEFCRKKEESCLKAIYLVDKNTNMILQWQHQIDRLLKEDKICCT